MCVYDCWYESVYYVCVCVCVYMSVGMTVCITCVFMCVCVYECWYESMYYMCVYVCVYERVYYVYVSSCSSPPWVSVSVEADQLTVELCQRSGHRRHFLPLAPPTVIHLHGGRESCHVTMSPHNR